MKTSGARRLDCNTHTLTHIHARTHTNSLTYTNTHTLTQTHTLTYAHTHTQRLYTPYITLLCVCERCQSEMLDDCSCRY